MVTCHECSRRFPPHLISELTIGGAGYEQPVRRKVCPICGLRLSNEATGLNRKNFDGPQAQAMLEEARRLVASQSN